MKRVIITISLIAAGISLHAQSVPFILQSTDARSMALASVGSEFLSASNALSGKTLDLGASYGYYDPKAAKTGMIGFNGYGNIGKFSIGLSGRYLMGKEYEMFDERAKSLGFFKTSEYSVGLNLAYAIAEKFALGLRASLISSKLTSSPATSVGIDVSAAFASNGFAAELAVRNLGPKIKYGDNAYSLPSMAVLGGSYKIGGFVARLEADYLFAGSFMAGAGVEYTFAKIVSLRAGFHYGDSKSVPMYASAGIGLQFAGVKLDFTYLPAISSNGGAMMGGLGYSF